MKKILSLMLACLMIMTAFTVTLPVFAASGTYASDAAAKVASMVCRIGDAGTGTYYGTIEEAIAAVAADATATITMIANDTIETGAAEGSNTHIKISKACDITIEGANNTLTFENGGIIPETTGIKLTVNNLNIHSAWKTGIQSFVQGRKGAKITFNNCNFTSASDAGKWVVNKDGAGQDYKIFQINNSSDAATDLVFNGGSISCALTHESLSNIWLFMFRDGNQKGSVEFNDVDFDLKDTVSGFYGMGNNATVTLRGDTALSLKGYGIGSVSGGKFNIADSASFNTTGELIKSGCSKIAIIVSSNAETPFGAYAAPTMKDGASLRVSAKSYGMRFVSEITEQTIEGATLSYGTVVTKKSTVDALTNVGDWYTAINMVGHDDYIHIPASNGVKTADGKVTVTASVVDIKAENVGVEVLGRAYVKYAYTESKVNVYVYSKLDTDKNTAIYKDVILEGLANVKTTADNEYKTEVAAYPVLTSGAYVWTSEKAYTRYTTLQYGELKTIAG